MGKYALELEDIENGESGEVDLLNLLDEANVLLDEELSVGGEVELEVRVSEISNGEKLGLQLVELGLGESLFVQDSVFLLLIFEFNVQKILLVGLSGGSAQQAAGDENKVLPSQEQLNQFALH